MSNLYIKLVIIGFSKHENSNKLLCIYYMILLYVISSRIYIYIYIYIKEPNILKIMRYKLTYNTYMC